MERRVPLRIEPWSARAGVLGGVLALALGFACARSARGEVVRPVIELRIASGVAEATAITVRAAVASQLAGLAALAGEGAPGATPELGVIHIEPNALEIVVRIVDLGGRPLATPRRLRGPLAEASASEIASIAHAFVVAASEAQASTIDDAEAATERSEAMQAAEAAAARTGPSARAESAQRAGPAQNDGAERSEVRPSEDAPESHARPAAPRAAVVVRSDQRPVRADVASAPAGTMRASWRVRLFGLYSGGHESAALGWQHGLRAETAVRLWRGLYAGAGYAYLAPAQLAGALATVRVQGHGTGGFVGFAHGFGAFALAGDLGFGYLRGRRETLRAASGFSETADAVRWEPRVGLRAHGLWRVPGLARLRLDLAPALELALTQRDLVVGRDLENPLSSPRWLRARLDFGASFDVL